MKWIFVAVIVFIVLVILRRISRENALSASTGGLEQPTLPPSGVLTLWQQRESLSFQDFREQYYEDCEIEAEDIHKLLTMISNATGVPEGKIRPDDRLEDLKPGALHLQLAVLKKVLTSDQFRDALPTGAPPEWRQETVDDVIRTLGPYGHLAHRAGA